MYCSAGGRQRLGWYGIPEEHATTATTFLRLESGSISESHEKVSTKTEHAHAVSKPVNPFFGESSLRPPMREKSACKKSPNKGRKSRQRLRRPSFGSTLCSTAGLIRSQQQSRPRSYSIPTTAPLRPPLSLPNPRPLSGCLMPLNI